MNFSNSVISVKVMKTNSGYIVGAAPLTVFHRVPRGHNSCRCFRIYWKSTYVFFLSVFFFKYIDESCACLAFCQRVLITPVLSHCILVTFRQCVSL